MPNKIKIYLIPVVLFLLVSCHGRGADQETLDYFGIPAGASFVKPISSRGFLIRGIEYKFPVHFPAEIIFEIFRKWAVKNGYTPDSKEGGNWGERVGIPSDTPNLCQFGNIDIWKNLKTNTEVSFVVFYLYQCKQKFDPSAELCNVQIYESKIHTPIETARATPAYMTEEEFKKKYGQE